MQQIMMDQGEWCCDYGQHNIILWCTVFSFYVLPLPIHRSVFKKCSFWVLAFVAFLVLTSPSDDDGSTLKKKKREKALRNKAEIAPVEVVKNQSEINRKIDLNEKYSQLEVSAPSSYGADSYASIGHNKFSNSESESKSSASYDDEGNEEDLDEEIKTVLADVDEAEEEEIEINDSMLVSAVRNMENNVKYYFGKVFGPNLEDEASSDFIDDLDYSEDDESSADIKLTDEQLDAIAKKISDRLEADVKKDFRDKADVIAEMKVQGKFYRCVCYDLVDSNSPSFSFLSPPPSLFRNRSSDS